MATLREAILLLCHDGLLERRHGSGVYVRVRPRGWVGIYTRADVVQPFPSYFRLQAIQQMRRRLLAAGYYSRVYLGLNAWDDNTWPSCPEFAEDILARRLQGVIGIHTHADPNWVQPLKAQSVPVVGDAPGLDGAEETHLEEVMQLGIRHLQSQGRTRLACLTFDDAEVPVTRQLWKDELHKAGMPFRESWLKADFHALARGAAWEELREVWGSDREKPDGLLITDEFLFRDALIAINELRIGMPDPLLVVTQCTRGSGLASGYPVSRLEVDPDRHAHALADLLMARMEGREPPPPPTMPLVRLVDACPGSQPKPDVPAHIGNNQSR